jgi:hypothetical protein
MKTQAMICIMRRELAAAAATQHTMQATPQTTFAPYSAGAAPRTSLTHGLMSPAALVTCDQMKNTNYVCHKEALYDPVVCEKWMV